MAPASRVRGAQPTDLPDASSLPTTEPASPPTPAGPLAFRMPEDDETTEAETWPAGDSPSASAEPSELLDARSDASPRSSRASSADANPFSRTGLRDAFREGVGVVGATAHELLARDQADADAGVFLADEDDQKAIGDPLAAIAYRHSSGLGDIANPDLGDAIAAALGLVFYAIKQMKRRKLAKMLRSGAAQAPAEPLADPGAGEDTTPAFYGPQNG